MKMNKKKSLTSTTTLIHNGFICAIESKILN